jgi:hypothetical protein
MWLNNERKYARKSLRTRSKNKAIEKGKEAYLEIFANRKIELSSKEELEPTLHSIKKAIDNGEFDTLLEEQLAYGSRLIKVN